jgi:dihydrofolate reductase
MRTLTVFNSITLDGFFTDLKGDMSWAHDNSDPEFNAFVADNANGGGELLFGRKTYDLMASFWPTPLAMQMNPVVAENMNSLPKVVFSSTMERADWNNTKLVKGKIVEEIRKMKSEPGRDMVIFGSGSIISQLAHENVIDKYQFVLIPVALGGGRSLFDGMGQKLNLKLTKTRVFDNGNVVLNYEPLID